MFYLKTLKTTLVVALMAMTLAFTATSQAEAEDFFFQKIGLFGDFKNPFASENTEMKNLNLLVREDLIRSYDKIDYIENPNLKNDKKLQALDGVSQIYLASYEINVSVAKKPANVSAFVVAIQKGYYRDGKLLFLPMKIVKTKKRLSAEGDSERDIYINTLSLFSMFVDDNVFVDLANKELAKISGYNVAVN